MRACWVALLVWGCGGPTTRSVDTPEFAQVDPGRVLLEYVVQEPDGEWYWEVARDGDRFVERRTREDGETWIVGRVGSAYFVQVGGAVRPAGAALAGQLATRAALFGGDARANERRWFRRGHELWYRPEDGNTIYFDAPRRRGAETRLPGAWDHSDLAGRLRICESLEWREPGVPQSGTCRATNSLNPQDSPRMIESTFELHAFERPDVLPGWALTEPSALQTPVTHEVPLLEPERPRIGVRFGDGEPLLMIIDTGAPKTVINADAARRAGVAVWGGVPLYMDPPYLPAGNAELAIADRVTMDELELPAMPIWVQEELGQGLTDGDGLLGMDVLRQVVLDIDPDAERIRLHPLGFDARSQQPEMTLPLAGTSYRVRAQGEVARLGRGLFIVDTGAAVSVIVTHPALQREYPRRNGDPVPRYFIEEGGTLDWMVDIDGHRLGPYPFPESRVMGRYHERDDIDSNLGLVGMGTMRFFRTVFALRDHEMHLWPTHAYIVLRRYGVELREDSGRVLVHRVARRGPFEVRQIHQEDIITHVGAVPVTDVATANRLLATLEASEIGLRVRREYRDGSVNAWTRVVAAQPYVGPEIR